MSGRSFPQVSAIALLLCKFRLIRKTQTKFMISGIFEEKNCWIYELYLLCQRFMLMIDVLKQFSLGQTVLLGCYWGTNTITWEKKVSQYSTKQSKQNFSQEMNNFFFLYPNFNHQPKVVFFLHYKMVKLKIWRKINLIMTSTEDLMEIC